MDSNNNSYHNIPGGHAPHSFDKPLGSSFAFASLLLGVATLITTMMMTVYFPFLFGGLAITFSILSKGNAKKMLLQAKVGIICSIAGVLLNIVLIISSISFLLSNPDVLIQAAQTYDNIYENIYGITSEEIFGDSLENIVTNIYDNN